MFERRRQERRQLLMDAMGETPATVTERSVIAQEQQAKALTALVILIRTQMGLTKTEADEVDFPMEPDVIEEHTKWQEPDDPELWISHSTDETSAELEAADATT